MPHIFNTAYWGPDKSTEVLFQPTSTHPHIDLVSACMVFAVDDDDKVVLSKPARGWGLLGGHREPGESAIECVRREALEEAAVEIDNLKLIGQWVTKKRFDSEHNRQYPDTAYQLLYLANVTRIYDFKPMHEVSERAFIASHDVGQYHHDFDNFEPILQYILDARRKSF